jgi:hypothetical protein
LAEEQRPHDATDSRGVFITIHNQGEGTMKKSKDAENLRAEYDAMFPALCPRCGLQGTTCEMLNHTCLFAARSTAWLEFSAREPITIQPRRDTIMDKSRWKEIVGDEIIDFETEYEEDFIILTPIFRCTRCGIKIDGDRLIRQISTKEWWCEACFKMRSASPV